MTDAKNHTTTFEYNSAGQQVKKILPDLTFEQFGYNAAGNQITHQLEDGNTNTFTYDNMNRLTQISYFDGQYANFTYTGTGHRDTASTRTQAPAVPQITDYDYDPFGRLESVTYPDEREISYTYNDNDQRASMTTPAGETTYGYDALGRLTSVTGPQSLVTSYQYDPVGFLTDIQRPNGVDTVITPNVRNHIDLITHSNSSGALQFFDYQLDKAGNRKQVTESSGTVIQWDYNNLYRLIDETRNGVSTQFEYDAAGNRDIMTVNGVLTDYDYNALDQLTSAGSVTYDYDDRGNLTQVTDGSNITNYTYDAADRLSTVTLPDTTSIAYVYDADGRRVQQTVGSQVTNYLWDEASAYGDVVLETNGSNSTSYVLGDTGVISQTRNSTTNYFLQDGQGSTRALTNSTTGVITDTYSYTAFGELFNQTGTTTNTYLYTGQQFDSLTGLYSLRARYYNPALGRFLSQDTYPYNFGNPIELNRYVYAANRPINLTDPTGRQALAEYSMLIGTVAGGVAGGLQAYACGGSPSSIMQGAFLGAMMGLTFASGALVYPALTLAAGMGLSAYGAVTSYNDMWQNGVNGCNTFSLGMSLLGLMSGAWGMGKGMGGPPGLEAIGVDGGGYTILQAATGINPISSALSGLGGVSLVSMISGWDRGDEPYIPEPGEEFGEGRHKGGIPPKRPGIYEYIDKFGEWYVGMTTNLYRRLVIQHKGDYANSNDFIWTEITTSSEKALYVAERARYEQMVKMVGGARNMANDPNQLISVTKARQFFDDGWIQKLGIPNWPDWLTKP